MTVVPRTFWSLAFGFRRLLNARDGAETIEFALAALPLMMFLFGVVEFARLYWTQSELQYAAEATARCITVNCCSGGPVACGGATGNTGYQNFAAKQILGMSLSSGSLSSFTVTSPAPACGNQVSFNYTFRFLVGPIIPNSNLTLSAQACNQA